MPASIAGSSVTGSSDSSLDFELAFQQEEDEVDESQLNVFQRCWRAFSIPFEIQVITLMTIPIICLCVFSVMIFVDTINRRDYLTGHAPLVESLFRCAGKMVDERVASTNWRSAYLTDPNSNATAEDMQLMLDLRVVVDAECEELADLAFNSGDPQVRNAYSPTVRRILQSHNLLRYRWDHWRIDASEFRTKVTDGIVIIEGGLSTLAQSKKLKFESLTLLQLREFRMVESYVGRSRTVCSGWIDACRSNTTYLELELEVRNVLNSVSQYIVSSLDIVTGYAETHFLNWHQDVDTQTMLTESTRILSCQTRLTSSQWKDLVGAVMDKLRVVVPAVMQELVAAKEQNTELRDEGIKLGVAVSTSILAAAYIIRAQIQSSRQISEEVLESKKLHRAVTKFVPESFLKLMGCTSVTHIVAGDQTEVSVAMLFADIHDFNAMTSSMTGEQLFDWLEVYFEQMSTITDNSHGFVDKFIGDAMFCVFMNATGATRANRSPRHHCVRHLQPQGVHRYGGQLLRDVPTVLLLRASRCLRIVLCELCVRQPRECPEHRHADQLHLWVPSRHSELFPDPLRKHQVRRRGPSVHLPRRSVLLPG